MADPKENVKIDNVEFCWGKKRARGGAKKDVQFYESCKYDGVEYFLYDSVYLFKEGEDVPYVGKLLKMYEGPNKAKKIGVLWFFRPSEISNYLEGQSVLENELFLASGDGDGLTNLNPLEAIAGKCNTVCISKDERNRLPSPAEIKMADYLYYRTFDVGSFCISDTFAEKIGVVDVRFLLNKKDTQQPDFAKAESGYFLENDGERRNNLSDDFECHPLAIRCVAGPDNAAAVGGVEKQLITNKIASTVYEDIKHDPSTDPLLVKDKQGSKEVGDVAGPDESGSANVLGIKTKVNKVVKCDMNGKPSENSVDQKYNLVDFVDPLDENTKTPRLNSIVNSGANNVRDSGALAAGNSGKSELEKVQRSVVSRGKMKAVRSSDVLEERPSKKHKLADTAGGSRDNAGMSTQKTATVTSKNASQPAGAAGIKHSTSNDLSKKLKSNGTIGERKANNASQLAKDAGKSPSSPNMTNNASQLARGVAENSNRGKLVKESVGTSSRFDKSNILMSGKLNDKLCKAPNNQLKDGKHEAYGCVVEVTRRPDIDRSNWFTALPWEDRIKEAHDQGKLVLLQNLDPAYTSSEVENIVWHGFKESCSAKMVQRIAISSPHSGQALVIFKTRGAAEKAVRKLNQDCLMLPNGRVLVGSSGGASFLDKQSAFPGHLIIDKVRHQMQKESREAVSTSHASQPNTIEYEMALEWGLLQDRSDLWWKILHKRQGEQTNKLKTSLKSKRVQAAR